MDHRPAAAVASAATAEIVSAPLSPPEPDGHRGSSGRGLVPRRRLVRRLIASRDRSLVLIAAPAGYGKTSLLSEWAEVDERPFAWVTLRRAQDEASELMASIGDALAAVGSRRRFVLVLDDAQTLESADALSLLPAIARALPAGSQLAVSSRTVPRLHLARLRAGRELAELRAADLAMTVAEASMLLDSAGLRLDEAQAEMLVNRVEGWPVALYLAALSLRGESDLTAALTAFAGDDQLLSEYLREELVEPLDVDTRDFLTCTSILDRLSAPVCDELLERSDSALLLQRLARRELLLVPLDRTGEAYRCPAPLHAMLSRELSDGQPRRAAVLHHRASVWYEQRGADEAAIAHAASAAGATRTGELLWPRLPLYLGQGRRRLVERWLDGFSESEVRSDAALSMCAAHTEAAGGDLPSAAHRRDAAEPALAALPAAPASRTLRAGALLLDASICDRGLARMGADAHAAYELESECSPWRALSRLHEGVAVHLAGDRARARRLLQDAVRRAAHAMPATEIASLAQLAVLDLDEGDWQVSQEHSARALELVDRHRLRDAPASALALAVAALSHAHSRRVDAAKEIMAEAIPLLAALDLFAAWQGIQTRVLLARCAVGLTDLSTARTLLAEASRARRRLDEAAVVDRWLQEAICELDSGAAGALDGSSSLTLAELRILRFLPTHLSFREIGDRLHVSTNTVKSQAHAVYRKLDARSRSEAVATACRLGLIWAAPGPGSGQ